LVSLVHMEPAFYHCAYFRRDEERVMNSLRSNWVGWTCQTGYWRWPCQAGPHSRHICPFISFTKTQSVIRLVDGHGQRRYDSSRPQILTRVLETANALSLGQVLRLASCSLASWVL
jgi:hypothetical protein